MQTATIDILSKNGILKSNLKYGKLKFSSLLRIRGLWNIIQCTTYWEIIDE